MKRIIPVFLILFFTASGLSAQKLKLVADYQQEYRMPERLSGMDLSAEQMSRITRRLNSMEPRKFALAIEGSRSGYELVGSSENQGQGSRLGMGNGGAVYKDTENGLSVNRVVLQDTVYLIKDTLPDWKWELHEETIEIGPLLCYMATTTVQSGFGPTRAGTDQNNGRRRRAAEPVEIVAWYCPEIDSDQGPGKYWGLPGLILLVEEAASTIQCTNIELYPNNFEGVIFPADGREIGAEEYGMKLRTMWQERREQRSPGN